MIVFNKWKSTIQNNLIMEYRTILKNSTLLITGGTGSFGKTLLNKLVNLDLNEIRIFSRDEKKQTDNRRELPYKFIKFYLGVVKEY